MKRLNIILLILSIFTNWASARYVNPVVSSLSYSVPNGIVGNEDENKGVVDSLRKVLFPEVRYYDYRDSIQPYGLFKPSPDLDIDIITPLPPDTCSSDLMIYLDDYKRYGIGEIEIIPGTSPSGAKTYTVPIKIYPGLNGCEPKLSLNYNSQAGVSLIGYGWSLGGLSSITRSGKSIFHDGRCEGVKMDSSDSFYLDGSRLLVIGEISEGYILFESEQGNIKVKGYKEDSLLTHFEVFYPDGSKALYGNELDCDIIYPVTKYTDRYGNEINYTYTTISNYTLISEIFYGNVRIDFKYEDREDPIYYYWGDNACIINSRISEIKCYNGSDKISSYRLYYEYKYDASLLTKISHVYNKSTLNPLRFSYGSTDILQGFELNTTQLEVGYESDYGNALRTVRGKFDHENSDDGIIVYPNYISYWHNYKSPGFVTFGENRLFNYYPEDQKILVYTSLGEDYAIPQTNILTGKGFIDVLCADLEGRLREAVIKVNNYGVGSYEDLMFTVYKPHSYHGLVPAYTRQYRLNAAYVDEQYYSSVQPKYYYVGDFDGDGKQEVFAVAASCPRNGMYQTSKCYLFDLENDKIIYEGYAFNYFVSLIGSETKDAWDCINQSDKLLAFDVDGDGKTDICLINDSGIHTYTFSTGSDGKLSLMEIGSCVSPNRNEVRNRDILLGEFNGDNLVDIALGAERGTSYTYSDWKIFSSCGNGNFKSRNVFGPGRPDTDAYFGLVAHDIDGDGKNRYYTIRRQWLLSPNL